MIHLESKEQNNQRKLKHRLIDTENGLMVSRGEGDAGRERRLKRLRSTGRQLLNSPGNGKHSAGSAAITLQ